MLYRSHSMRGDSLIEVVLALWLLGVAAWAAVHLHLQMMHLEHTLQWHAQALCLLEGAAQSIESGEDIASTQMRLNKQAIAHLPNGKIVIRSLPMGISHASLAQGPFLVEVQWTTRSARLPSGQAVFLESAFTHNKTEYQRSISVPVMRYIES